MFKAKIVKSRAIAALSVLVIAVTLGVVYKVALAGNHLVNLLGGEVSNPARTWVLSGLVLDTTTNKVSGSLVMTETRALSNIVAATLEFGTYDGSSLPLVIDKNPMTVQAVYDGVAKTLTWDFTDLQIPEGERFAGVYVSGGSYLRGGTLPVTVPLVVALVFAYGDY